MRCASACRGPAACGVPREAELARAQEPPGAGHREPLLVDDGRRLARARARRRRCSSGRGSAATAAASATTRRAPSRASRPAGTSSSALGIAMPIAVISTLFVISDLFVIKTTQAPAATATKMTVDVIGHQWWWEVRYPGTTAVTANEMHIPVRTPVRVEVAHRRRDPQLLGAASSTGRSTRSPAARTRSSSTPTRRAATAAQCAEFCGLQHAHMGALRLRAAGGARSGKWLANESRPAAAPAGGAAAEGARVFQDGACSSCHAIRGTSASSDVGPDLTHVGEPHDARRADDPERRREPARLDHRHAAHQAGEPDAGHPTSPSSRLDALVAYLEGLK